MLFFIALLFVWIPCAIIAEKIANAKGLDAGGWGLAAFLFGPIGLIGVVGMPDRKLNSYMRAIAIKLEALENVVEYGSVSDSISKPFLPIDAKSGYFYVKGTVSNFEERASIIIKQLPEEIQSDASTKNTDIKFGKMSFVVNDEGKETARLVYVRFKDGCHVYKLG